MKISPKSKNTGVIEIEMNRFHLICEGRVYKLEAQSVEDKKSWIDALNICMKHACEHEEKGELNLKDLPNLFIQNKKHYLRLMMILFLKKIMTSRKKRVQAN